MSTQWEMKKAELLAEHLENTVPSDMPHAIYSGTYIPTLDNFPASHWRRKNGLGHHEGEVFIKQPKYIYVFTKKEDGSFFWKQVWQQDNLDRFISAMNKKRRSRTPGGWK